MAFQLLQMLRRVGAQDGGIAGRRRLAPGERQLVLRLEQIHRRADARGALRMAARRILGAAGVGDDGQGQGSDSFFVRVNEIDERLQVVAMRQAGLFLAHFQARFDASSSRPRLRTKVVEGLLFRVSLLDVLGHPIGHLAVGDGVLDDWMNVSAVTPAALSQAPSKPLVKFSW
jgi:hypothetical protein